MASLSARLTRLEIVTTPAQPIEIEFHVIEVVAIEDTRRGSWADTTTAANKTITFYVTSADEFHHLRNQYKAKRKTLSLTIDAECLNFTIALPEGPITVTNS
ncbi:MULTISPECIES: hypothetical protein [Klebsiella/Raoultella group]|uniref:hypothetical protein n=1 Tax=Klebsiella/Raoultella group TaxID=2890311 RepID=UPI0013EF801E|nr:MULTISPECIES: hypothetical protein [Klebsiella/Raoultella group]WPS29588.1 hypothetical protein SM913_07410 [Klebsiella aerogenes]